MRKHLSVSLLYLAINFQALSAQQFRPAPATSSGCTYATCALRLEPGFFGLRIVAGASGDSTVGKLGLFGGGVGVLLAGRDSASSYARDYVSSSKRGAFLGIAGAVAFAIAFNNAERSRGGRDFDGVSLAAGAVGLTFAIASIPVTIKTQRSLSRAIWWYNEGLPH